MKKFIMSIVVLFCLVALSYSQDYRTGVGLRAGFANGLTIKHFIGERSAAEFLFASRWHGLEITGLYEIHHNAFEISRLNWYYGIGAHVGFWNGNYTPWGTNGNSYTVIGIDGILGIEYNFGELPFNLGIDWKPAFNVVGYTGFWGDGGAISLRYIY